MEQMLRIERLQWYPGDEQTHTPPPPKRQKREQDNKSITRGIELEEPVETSSGKWRHLFYKALTPSDAKVKSPRLCLPSKSARYFINLPKNTQDTKMQGKKDISIVDENGRVWLFEYTYNYDVRDMKETYIRKDWGEYVRTYNPSQGDELHFYENTETKKMGITLKRIINSEC